MAKRLQFCTALLLSMSVFVTGCTVDVQDPNEQENDPTQPEDPSTTNTAPVIELVGEPVITIPVNSSFVDPGVQATDAEDGDVTGAVYSNNMQVSTSQPGQYEITYRVTDSANMAAQPVKRIVIVSEPVVTPEEPAVEPGESVELAPAIDELKLVGFTGADAREMVELSTLVNGAVIDLSQTSIDQLNIVAESVDVAKTGSVHFKLSGPVSVDRWENNARYTMVVETVNFSVSKSEFPVGDYTLSVTPYALPDMTGNKGAVKTIKFKVVDNQIISSVPKIAAVNLVSVTETKGDYVVISRITEGVEIDLGELPTNLINVIAVSEDASKTGSVQFLLSGPVEINRTESNAAYALANETQHLDLSKNELPAGDYSLVVTPYAEADANGEAGIPLLVNFSVSGETGVPEEPVVVTPPAAEPMAKADVYTFYMGSDAQPGQAQPVSANDEFENGAVYAITKAPSHGSINMFDMGFFTYTPDPGFSGSDTFTYQIAQSDKTSSASVSIEVVAPSQGSSTGFTIIKPSADSKLIYVSSSAGSDANTCLTEAAPCKTVAAGLDKMRSGYPDHLYLKRGDSWRGERLVNLHSGRSASEPAVISYYGTSGARPKLENSSPSIHIFKGKMSNFHFIGLEFSSYQLDPAHPNFSGDGEANIVLLGGNQNLVFEDNKFSFVEMILQNWETGNPANITLRRNIWTGAYYHKSSYDRNDRPSNLYADGVDGLLIEENVFDYGGWNPDVVGAAANMYNHNMYIQHTTVGNKLVVKNNIVTRASSHGIHGRPGGLFENNFFARNTVSLQMGYNGHPLPAGTKAQAINNVITEGTSMVKGKDACKGVNLCTSAVWGLIINEPGAGIFTVKGNLLHSGYQDDNLWSTLYKGLNRVGITELTGSSYSYSNNILWKWKGDADVASGSYPAPGRTLADYNKSLGGAQSFDEFMNKVKNRPVGSWDKRYTAESINSYIRAGFGLSN